MTSVPEKTMLNWNNLQATMSVPKKRAMRALVAEYTSLLKDPPEGFVVKVDDPFVWDVGIYGPPSTPFWGGYFKLQVTFPDDYPFVPPKLKFKNRFWHPNVYYNGAVCMSILHDPHAEEIPSDLPKEEKWNPTLSVRTVLLSLISILGAPNPDSPANPEASKMYRCWIEDGDQDYVKVIEDIVKRSKKTASRDGVTVPKTLEEYLSSTKSNAKETLVDYYEKDENYSSDQSDLLSLPSSEDSDLEESHTSGSSHVQTSVAQNTSNSIVEDSNLQSTEEPGPFSVQSPPEYLSGVRNVKDTSCQRNIIENTLAGYNELSRSETNPVSIPVSIPALMDNLQTSTQIDNGNILNNLNTSTPSHNDTEESFATLSIHQESLNEPLTRLSRDGTETNIIYTDFGPINGDIPANDELAVAERVTRTTASLQHPITSRKRRRPPRLYIFAQQSEIKKRRKQ